MKKRVRQGDPERERQWQAAMQRWQQSGLTARDYCRTHGLKESAFYFWRQKLTRRANRPSPCQQRAGKTRKHERAVMPSQPRGLAVAASSPAERAKFLPVRIVSPAAEENRHGLEIALAGGRTVHVPRGFDRQTLADVLAVLDAWPC